MNRIDTKTGYSYLGDVVITPDKKIADYKEYEKAGLVKFINEIGGIAVITVNDMTGSNGINTSVVISIDEILGYAIIQATPINITTERIIASKKWLAGMIENCNVDDSEDPFFAEYSWGYISVKYVYDHRAGVMDGGNIKICYDNESSI